MLLKKIIKKLPIDIQRINIKGMSLDSRQIKKNYLILLLKEQILMVKIIFLAQLKKEREL